MYGTYIFIYLSLLLTTNDKEGSTHQKIISLRTNREQIFVDNTNNYSLSCMHGVEPRNTAFSKTSQHQFEVTV